MLEDLLVFFQVNQCRRCECIMYNKLQSSGDFRDNILCSSCSWDLSQCSVWIYWLHFWRILHLCLLNLSGVFAWGRGISITLPGNLQWHLQHLWQHHLLPRQHKVGNFLKDMDRFEFFNITRFFFDLLGRSIILLCNLIPRTLYIAYVSSGLPPTCSAWELLTLSCSCLVSFPCSNLYVLSAQGSCWKSWP